jgi:hypothetical protein
MGGRSQSTIGNVAAGSLFATAQSAGASESGLAAVDAASQAGGLLMTACNGGLSWFQQKLYIYGLNVLAELCTYIPHIEDRYRPMYIG